jgi:hypothetical protein
LANVRRCATGALVAGPKAEAQVGSRGTWQAFWFATYAGGLTGARFVTLLRRMMRGRRKPLRLIVDGLPAHRTRLVRDYRQRTRGQAGAKG